MTVFLRLLEESNKSQALLNVCARFRDDESEECCFSVAPNSFDAIPGKPFAYWVSQFVRDLFKVYPAFEDDGRSAKLGGSTKNDFRFLRVWWEAWSRKWALFAKGGIYSPFYADIYLHIKWLSNAKEIESELLLKFPYLGNSAEFVLHRNNPYFSPGITWPRRTQGGLSLRAMPAGCIFADKGPAAFVADDKPESLLALLAITNSQAFRLLVSLQMAFGSYEVGVIQRTPVPDLNSHNRKELANLARRAWSLKRTLDTVHETSHAFLLPAALRARLGDYDPPAITAELDAIQATIDEIAFDLYGFEEADRQAALAAGSGGTNDEQPEADDDEDDDAAAEEGMDSLLAWAAGVAFGRFDHRLATGERQAPPEPEPFDPLPAQSPDMLPNDAQPFHAHAGILVDDPGHPHDLPRLIEAVLERVAVEVPDDLRRWLRRDFFPFHLKQYSKSRRKAPIYWPLATASGGYTLWLYYPALTGQTLYTAVNDFIEPKLAEIGRTVAQLRDKGTARSRAEERDYEAAEAFERELKDLRDSLLERAARYRPNHDDGVQISAAPLWPLFRHRPWQTLLKGTWQKLEQGDYDWAHLALNYWPERVLRKCHQDRSLAIAHDVEADFWEEVEEPVIRRGKPTDETKPVWRPRPFGEAELAALVQRLSIERR